MMKVASLMWAGAAEQKELPKMALIKAQQANDVSLGVISTFSNVQVELVLVFW